MAQKLQISKDFKTSNTQKKALNFFGLFNLNQFAVKIFAVLINVQFFVNSKNVENFVL